MKGKRPEENRRILARVGPDEFVGRSAELTQLVSHGSRNDRVRGLLVLLAPLAGVSELLRQAYDQLFNQRGNLIPICFSLARTETTAVSAAIEFLNTFLLQYVSFRRNDPSLCQTSLTLDDVVQLAPDADADWIGELVDSYKRLRFGDDDREFVRFCLTAPNRVPPRNGRPFVMFDAVQLSTYPNAPVPLGSEIVRALVLSDLRFALAGLRREVIDAIDRAAVVVDSLERLSLEKLEEEDARKLVTEAARRQQVSISEEIRDLLVEQFEGSPFFITALLEGAREKNIALTTYLDCERLYVDELMGGRLHRYFSSLLERVTPDAQTRRLLFRLLSQSDVGGSRKSSFANWQKQLNLGADEVEEILHRLHVQELVNWDGDTIDAQGGPTAWTDYLSGRFRLDNLREPRALVVADMIASALKRAPRTIALHHRRIAKIPLRELLERFNSQRLPRSLFDYEQFADAYKGLSDEERSIKLDADTELIRLPQVFHAASCASFSSEARAFGDEDRCVVAHAFEGATYADANEITWLVAEIDSKAEADRKTTELWCDRLDTLARRSGFLRTQLWLIANEDFDTDASRLLRERGSYSSGRQQLELLTARLGESEKITRVSGESDEFVMIIPMGADNEIVAANTAEQIARRLNFRPEAINQIKTAIVEACINASEHSLSPDRKIYQRFRVEDDRLVITISSRGVVPSNIERQNGEAETESGKGTDPSRQRRGWGLRLIKTLMDEVEFERVDEGTSLRMTKYLRKSES